MHSVAIIDYSACLNLEWLVNELLTVFKGDALGTIYNYGVVLGPSIVKPY